MARLTKYSIFTFFLFLLVLIQAAQPNGTDALGRYQKVLSETKNSRLFRYDDGAPKNESVYNCVDKFGYLWTETNPFKLYRFNGVSFTEWTSLFPQAERDSLIEYSFVDDDDRNIYLFGRHYLYRWNGYKFVRYAFPKDDRIKVITMVKNKPLAIGNKGYAVLNGDNWKYIRIPVIHYSQDVARSYSWVSGVEEKDLLLSETAQEWTLDVKDRLYEMHYDRNWNYQTGESIIEVPKTEFTITRYSSAGREILACISKQALQSDFVQKNQPFRPEFKITDQHEIYIQCLGTDDLYYLDGKRSLFSKTTWPKGALLQTYGNAGRKAFAFSRNDTLFVKITERPTAIDIHEQDYYFPGYDPLCEYNILYQDSSIGIKPGKERYTKSRSVYLRIIPGIDYINPLKTSELNDEEVFIQDGRLAYSIVNKAVKGTHRVYVKDPVNNVDSFIDVADDAEHLKIIDFNRAGKSIMVAGKEGIRLLSYDAQVRSVFSFPPFEYIYQLKAQPSSNYGMFPMVVTLDENSIPTVNMYQHYKGDIRKLGAFKSPIGATGTKDVQFIYTWNHDNVSDKYRLDFISGKLTKLSQIENLSSAQSHNDATILVFDNQSYVFSMPGQPDLKGDFSTVTQPWLSMLSSHKINSDLLDGPISGSFVDDTTLFFNSSTHPVVTNAQGEKALSAITPGFGQSPLPPVKTQVRSKPIPAFDRVALLFDCTENKVYEKPDWLEAITLNSAKQEFTKILYIDNEEKTKSLRISDYQNKELKPSDGDFIYPLPGNYLPDYQILTDYNVYFMKIENDIHYNFKDKWQQFPLSPFHLLGDLKDLRQVDQDLWLVFEAALVRYSMSRKEYFMFTSRDGLPEKMGAMYYTDGAYFIVAADGIYRFSPQEDGAQLVVPWIQVNNTSYSSGILNRLKYNQNNFVIPVDILNTMFPERVKLSYRLLGYEKNWKTRDYTPLIDYPKLPPGHYEFQIYGTSPTGMQSKPLSVFFIIKAPVYGTWWAFLFYALGLFALGRYLYRLRIKQLQRRNEALEQTVMLRTHELQERQRHIQESIEYALLIQKSILPQEADLAGAFKEHFVLWKPRATVGGDFYWLHRTEDGCIWFALIDCTGHGVPGALLSMTVNSLLNHLIKDKGMDKPSEILQTVHREIGMALHQDRENTQQDGIEIALLKLKEQNLIFSGAGLHMLHYERQTRRLQQIRGDKRGLGGLKWHSELSFTEHHIPWNPQMRIYLYTDGIIDQPLPLDERLQRLGNPRWLEQVQNLAELPFVEQHNILEERLQVMLNYDEQRDDITIIGLQIG